MEYGTFRNNDPLPTNRSGKQGGDKYKIDQLTVRQSVRVMVDEIYPEHGRQIDPETLRLRVWSCAVYIRKKTGKQFTCRKIPGGVQVWRTA